MEDLGAGPQRFGEGRQAERHDHELLQVDAAVGVRAAVEDVHHRRGQHVAPRPALPGESARGAVERLARGGRGGARGRHRHAEQRVCAEPALGRRAVQLDERVVDRALIELWPTSIVAISPLTLATALRTPLPR